MRIAAGDMIEAERRLRRAIVRAGRHDAVPQDLIDAADVALAAGMADAARPLYGLVFLQDGFSPRALARRAAIAGGTGLWQRLPDPGDMPRPTGVSVDAAVAELREAAALHPRLAPLEFDPAALVSAEPMGPAVADHAAERRLAAEVVAMLRDVPEADAPPTATLRALARPLAVLRPIGPEARMDAGLDELAGVLALEHVRRLVLAAYDLLAAEPAGRLFEAASRFDPTALGAFCANVELVVRDARDLVGMAEIAAAGDGPAAVEAWCVLLSGRLPREPLLDLIDELGDRNMTTALRYILARHARLRPADRPLEPAWRLRDAAIDLGDRALAAAAQQLVAAWSPLDPVEWCFLADLLARQGDVAGAEAALGRALQVAPGDAAVLARLSDLHAGTLFEGETTPGSSTSRGRLLIRQRFRRPPVD